MHDTKERRFVSASRVKVEKRGSDDSAPPTIIGYGAVFFDGTPGTEFEYDDWMGVSCRERIMPGCFDRVLSEQQDVRALFNHDVNHVLGRVSSQTCKLSVDATGLRYEINPPDSGQSRHICELIQRGDISGSSFAFIARSVNWVEQSNPDGTGVIYREVTDADVYDVGPVTFPAYGSASAGVRAEGDVESLRAEFKHWKAKQTPRSSMLTRANVQVRLLEIQEQNLTLR